jgi:hypothetical protein
MQAGGGQEVDVRKAKVAKPDVAVGGEQEVLSWDISVPEAGKATEQLTSGLMSRWINPCLWQDSIASIIYVKIRQSFRVTGG